MRTHSICLAPAILVLCPFASAQWESIGPPLINQYTFAVSGPGDFSAITSQLLYHSTNHDQWSAT
jgi:hypothetical protein